MTLPQKTRKWYQVRWFQEQDTKEERKLIVKLDLLIVPYVFLVSAVGDVPNMDLTRHHRHTGSSTLIKQISVSSIHSALNETELTLRRQCIRRWDERRPRFPRQ